MKYINKFSDLAAYMAAKSTLYKPHLSLISDTRRIMYDPKPRTFTFYINNDSNVDICEEGMSWSAWFNSVYNKSNYDTLYTKQSYNSGLGESSQDYLINVNDSPVGGGTYYSTCVDDYVEEETTEDPDPTYYLRIDTSKSGYSFENYVITIGLGKLDITDKSITVDSLANLIARDSGNTARLYKSGNYVLINNGLLFTILDVKEKTPLQIAQDLNKVSLLDFLNYFNHSYDIYYTNLEIVD